MAKTGFDNVLALMTHEDSRALCDSITARRIAEKSAELHGLVEKLRSEARKAGAPAELLEQAAHAVTDGEAWMRRVFELDAVISSARSALGNAPRTDLP
jgi:hypothetical protein